MQTSDSHSDAVSVSECHQVLISKHVKFSPVTSVVCDAGHNTVYIPTQRKKKSWRQSEINRVEDFVAMLVTSRRLCI